MGDFPSRFSTIGWGEAGSFLTFRRFPYPFGTFHVLYILPLFCIMLTEGVGCYGDRYELPGGRETWDELEVGLKFQGVVSHSRVI